MHVIQDDCTLEPIYVQFNVIYIETIVQISLAPSWIAFKYTIHILQGSNSASLTMILSAAYCEMPWKSRGRGENPHQGQIDIFKN